MLATNDHNRWLLRILLLVLVSNLNQWQINTAITFSDGRKLNKLKWRHLRYILNLSEVHLHLRIGIRYRVRNKNLVLLVSEFKVERHTIIRLKFVWVHLIYLLVIGRDVVVDVETAMVPAYARVKIISQRPNTRFHSIVK